MEQSKIIGDSLRRMCRLCLSHDVTLSEMFCFSPELGKKIADVVMECAPVQITRRDKLPTCICELCFTRLKNFHQFQMQIIQSDKTLQHYLQQLSDYHTQVQVESALEEHFDNSESQYIADVATKFEPFEISDEFNNVFLKQEVVENLSPVNKTNEEIPLKSEIKEEPMDDNSLNSNECADAVETPFMCEGYEISCEDSVIDVGITKVGIDAPGNFEGFPKFECGMREKKTVKPEETFIPIKETDNSLGSENVKDVEKSATSTGRKSHQCDICKMCFSRPSYLKSHKFKHTGEKPYQCDICQMCFKNAANLKSHKLEHTGEKPYQCETCKKCFFESSKLKRHNLIHIGEKLYQCEICNKCFFDSSKLKRHNLTHTGEKPYKCDICQMCFRQMSYLKEHKLKHTGEKPYQCDICQICFRLSNSLKKHKLKHTGEKPYQCDICQMCFRQTNQLKSHKLKHTGEKPYQCDICQMCFRHSNSLNSHKLRHTGEKPYQCDICQMCFRQMTHLKDHKLKHTGEKPYQCDICQMCFRHSNSLKKHKIKHTGKKPCQ